MPSTPFQTTNPTTGERLQSFPMLTDHQVERALHGAELRYRMDWKRRLIADRSAILKAAAALLRERREELAGLATLEMGKLITQARAEVMLSADIFDYYADQAAKFLRPRPVDGLEGTIVVSEPLGVLVAIEPWNFPYYQLARVAAPQLVAGNVLLVKHAPSVPQCALAFAQVLIDAGAPEGVYTNLFCSEEQIGAAIDDSRVRGVMLTGSERAGAAIAQRAGRALKKVVLELGGSDPMLVLDDAPLEKAARIAAGARLMNTGQACAASKRLIVVGADRAAALTAMLKDAFDQLIAGDPAEDRTTLGPLYSAEGLERLEAQVTRAVTAGARVVTGGERIERAGFFYRPTILTNVTADNPIHREETFGPVLVVYAVESEAEAIAVANDSPYGLGSSIITDDPQRAHRVATEIEAGMVFINSGVSTRPQTPFGGVKNSGFGKELGEAGIGEFINRKMIRSPA